jgi:predicted RNA-binding Zn-ribbon protein involved in translation (DUF1610 family)
MSNTTQVPYADDVACAGPDAPKCDRIDELIRLLVTIRHRFGNTAVQYRVTWGGSALWTEDELRGQIRQLEADRDQLRQQLWECPDCGFEMHKRHFREPGEGEDYHACPACGELALRERLRLLTEAAMPLQLWLEARRWVANESVLASVPISPQERNGHDMTFGELRNILAALVPAPEAGRG